MVNLQLQTPAVLAMGAPGSGKTDSLATWVEAGLDLFVIVTEPDGIASLVDSMQRRKPNMDRVHWATCLPTTMGWEALNDMVKTIGSMGFDQIQNIKSGVGKQYTREPAMKLLKLVADFQDEHTGKSFGPVDKWPSDRVLAVDSLSGISLISWMLTIGYKPAAHQGEWGVAMNFIEQVLNKLSSDRRYYFCLNAHLERESNELTGAAQNMVSTLGRKLAPKIPRFFSEVIMAKRSVKDGKAHFIWSTFETQADLKNRSLPLGNELPQSYVPVVRAYERRREIATAMPQAVAGPVQTAAS